jgi:hypothetical protein
VVGNIRTFWKTKLGTHHTHEAKYILDPNVRSFSLLPINRDFAFRYVEHTHPEQVWGLFSFPHSQLTGHFYSTWSIFLFFGINNWSSQCVSQMSVPTYRSTQCHNPQNSTNLHHCVNFERHFPKHHYDDSEKLHQTPRDGKVTK